MVDVDIDIWVHSSVVGWRRAREGLVDKGREVSWGELILSKYVE